AGVQAAERRLGERVRDERDGETCAVHLGQRQRYPLDGDRPLLDAVAQHLDRGLEADARALALRLDGAHTADRVDVALDVVAAERIPDAERRLDVHARTRLEPAERAAAERLGHRVELDLA